jgi:hypothetical protein
MKIETKFDTKEMVYLIHDVEKLPRMITAITIKPNGVSYELCCGTQATWHYDFEITREIKKNYT